MGVLPAFTYGPLELSGWVLQVLLLVLVSARVNGRLELPGPNVSICLLVIAGGWILRLAYLFALASDGFLYWIGDDPVRWLAAWSWAQDPFDEVAIVAGWMPGTTVLHGTAMALADNPVFASKLLSASYSVLSLVGVFLFALAVFRNRVASVVSVFLLAPSWIDILLSGGTMTEMPTVGLMLVGAAAVVQGLRSPAGRVRTLLLAAAASSFALATTFHMVAWVLLTASLLFLLPVFMCSERGSSLARLRAWVLFSALSTSWCLVWATHQWVSTGSPLTMMRELGELQIFKIGGPLDLVEVLGPVASVGQTLIVGAALLVFAVTVALAFVTPGKDGRVIGRLDADRFRFSRRIVAALAGLLLVVAFPVIRQWLRDLSPDERQLVVSNVLVFPLSLLACAYYYWPLLLGGLLFTLSDAEARDRAPRLVLACITFAFVLLMFTSITGGANVSPYRTVLSLSTALLPFAVAPLFAPSVPAASHGAASSSRSSLVGGAKLTLGAGVLVLVLNASANHERIGLEVSSEGGVRPAGEVAIRPVDVYALGAWMHQELRSPTTLRPENLTHPFELTLERNWGGVGQVLVEYHVGDPALFATPRWQRESSTEDATQIVQRLAPSQLLISDYEVPLPGLRLVARVSRFWIYERSPR